MNIRTAGMEDYAFLSENDRVMTSTRSDEEAQHFYRGLGYTDCGALLLPGEPLELIFRKEICL